MQREVQGFLKQMRDSHTACSTCASGRSNKRVNNDVILCHLFRISKLSLNERSGAGSIHEREVVSKRKPLGDALILISVGAGELTPVPNRIRTKVHGLSGFFQNPCDENNEAQI